MPSCCGHLSASWSAAREDAYAPDARQRPDLGPLRRRRQARVRAGGSAARVFSPATATCPSTPMRPRVARSTKAPAAPSARPAAAEPRLVTRPADDHPLGDPRAPAISFGDDTLEAYVADLCRRHNPRAELNVYLKKQLDNLVAATAAGRAWRSPLCGLQRRNGRLADRVPLPLRFLNLRYPILGNRRRALGVRTN